MPKDIQQYNDFKQNRENNSSDKTKSLIIPKNKNIITNNFNNLSISIKTK